MSLFIQKFPEDPMYYLSWVLVMMFSICVHEYAHARTALRHGDGTAAWMGHLTLNPLVQMGWPSIIMLLICGIAWGAVPVNVRAMRHRSSAAQVAAAGPLSNLILALIFSGLHVLVSMLGAEASARFLLLATAVNAMLFLFNLIPIPMFDGWAIFSLWFPRMQRIDPMLFQQLSWGGLLLLWMTPLGSYIWVGAFGLTAVLSGVWSLLLPG